MAQQGEFAQTDGSVNPPPQAQQPMMGQPMQVQPERQQISIVGPLAFWIIIIIVGLVLEILGSAFSILSLFTTLGGWIVYLPGTIILPLIAGLWIGEKVGSARNKVGSAVSLGLVNAIYAALIYVIAIFIIYLIVNYVVQPQTHIQTLLSTLTLTTFLEYGIGLPVVLVLIVAPLIAALSAARHSNM